MTKEELFAKLEEDFGMAGVFAAESMCLTQDDFDEGYDWCLDCIAPALEEELMAQEVYEEDQLD